MHPLADEAVWAANALRPLKTAHDSSVLLVSWNALDAYLDALAACWGHERAVHAVAIKSQPHSAVLRHIVDRGFGLEAATWEEVLLARAAGCPPDRIVFDSPVKRPHELEDCAANSPGMLVNANSLEELDRLKPFAGRLRLGLRINPMVEVDAPSVYQVSGDESKFGTPIADRAAILEAVLAHPIEALHVHSGSSMNDTHGAVRALTRLRDLAVEANERLAAAGSSRRITTLDIGGGLKPEHLDGQGSAPQMTAYASALRVAVPELWSDFSLVTEFGQWTHFHTGYALSDVEYVLPRGDRSVVYLHLGADFLLRDAYVRPRGISWLPLREGTEVTGSPVLTDLAGPLCFAGDYLEKGCMLPQLQSGDEVLFLGTGSNAYALWSRHTSRSIPAVYGVDYANRRLELLSERTNPFI